MRVQMFLTTLLTLAPALTSAQVLLAPDPQPANQNVKCGEFDNPAVPLTALRDDYQSGRWEKLLADTRTLLGKCAFVTESADPKLFPANYTRDWY